MARGRADVGRRSDAARDLRRDRGNFCPLATANHCTEYHEVSPAAGTRNLVSYWSKSGPWSDVSKGILRAISSGLLLISSSIAILAASAGSWL